MSEKIFVDLDEEIIFITEKIEKIEGDRVILIIPDRAALLGSIVSVKLLFSEIAKRGKDVVLITKDEVGRRLAKKANFEVVEKASQISEQTWENARELKEKFLSKRKQDKDKLLGERKEKVPESVGLAIKRPEKSGNVLKKIEPKKIDIGGFEMIAGGDIAKVETVVTDGLKAGVSSKAFDGKEKSRSNESMESSKKTNQRDKQRMDSFVGKDLSTLGYTSIPSMSKKKKESNVSDGISKVSGKIKDFLTSGGVKQKVIIGIGVLFIVFFALSYFVLPSGRVVVRVESQDIEIEKEVIADTAVVTLDIESLTIPAKVIESVKDRSEGTQATGIKETGSNASGQVTLFNLTESEVQIHSGTFLESIETGLKYTTTSEVLVPAKKPDDDPESPGLIGNVDVGIISESFGEDYNVSKKVEFRVAGFDVENLYGKNFNNITGGTTEEKKVVSQEDYDKLKSELEEQLKQDLLNSLKDEAGSSRKLLEDTITYEVINEDASPGIDAETDTFNLSVTVKATGLSFLNEDVDNLAENLVEENDQDVEVEEFEYSSEVIKTEGNQIYINLAITGVVTPSINIEGVKSNLTGKSRSGAEQYLGEQGELESFEIELFPRWMPGFLKHFPSSVDKIEIKIEKV